MSWRSHGRSANAAVGEPLKANQPARRGEPGESGLEGDIEYAFRQGASDGCAPRDPGGPVDDDRATLGADPDRASIHRRADQGPEAREVRVARKIGHRP